MQSAPSDVREDAGNVQSPPLLADTETLHRAFLAERPALLTQARAELGIDASSLAPKVVEMAFVAAWNSRDAIHSENQFHHFLADEVHHGAARTLSRRAAAHRVGGHDNGHASHAAPSVSTEPGAEAAWTHLDSALHGTTHRADALVQAAAVTRHEAAGHIADFSRHGTPRWVWVLLALCLLAGAIGFVRVMDYLGADSRAATAVSSTEVRVVSSLPAQMGLLTLDDGSKVRLAPDTKLTIPQAFGVQLRAVKLEGAAGFEVTPGLEREFQLRVRDAVLSVKGTSFIVRAYKEDPAVTVVVRTGSVEARQGAMVRLLSAGDAVVIGDAPAIRPATADERAAAESWHEGTLAITNLPLAEALAQMKRWYGWTVAAPDSSLLGRRVTVRASLDSARQAVRGIETSGGVELVWVNEHMVLRDRKGAKSKSRSGVK